MTTAHNPKPSRSNNVILVASGLLVLAALIGVTNHFAFNTNPKVSPQLATATLAPAHLAPAAVSITSNGFVPATVSVRPGQAVVWTNTDTAAHQVTSDPYANTTALPGLNSQQNLTSNDSYSYVFGAAGTYSYHDVIGSGFKGEVVVR